MHRRITGEANWPQILHLYDALQTLTGSPVVAVNRAMALAHTSEPSAALALLEALAPDARMEQYQPYWAARAHILARAHRAAEARHAFDVAIGLEHDSAVRRFLQRQRAAIGQLGRN